MNIKGPLRRSPDDAISQLMADHRKIDALFRRFEALKESGSAKDKAQLVSQICDELAIHAVVEEEIFYPAVRARIGYAYIVDEALVEHAGANELVAQLRAMVPGDELYDDRVTLLGEEIGHHVEEEEGEIFPEARKAKIDTGALGLRMCARKVELLEVLGLDDPKANAGAAARESAAARA